MPNIGPLEIAIVLIIALVVFGPKKLPSLGRSVGEGLREFRSSVSSVSPQETAISKSDPSNRSEGQTSPPRKGSQTV
ncbi:MAG: twin-arginine translocase TatA/TatE family subunit [Thermoleophilia bacterium]|nr:twin-arginine translocase TatA/TatE family subunit [Thermoleophilia bacterium]